jgi:lysophospholipase L1-like esterase
MPVLSTFLIFFSVLVSSSAAVGVQRVHNTDPLIFYHGRWDKSPGTWWAGSGFKLHIQGLTSISLNLGPGTTSPNASVGVSVDYEPFFIVNVTEGANKIPLPGKLDYHAQAESKRTVLRVNVEGWQSNRIHLESIDLNPDAHLLPYKPSKLAFQFIGDSLSAGQFLPLGVDQAWPFLVGEKFKAEHTINAQPGATLTDMVSYGNVHGVSFQFFKTEDTGYYYTTDHNFTTPWNFTRDHPQPSHLAVHIGANDASHNVTDADFVQNYIHFLGRLRTLYPHQPMFIFTPWGWPSADGSVSYYYDGQYQIIVNKRKKMGDHNTFLVNTTGWVTFADVFTDNVHPDVNGHAKIAGLFEDWLVKWGLKPEEHWATSV